MRSWLKRKIEDKTVSFLISELKLILEKMPLPARAQILAISQLERVRMESLGFPVGVLEQPFNFSRDKLYEIFNELNALRVNSLSYNKKQIKNLKRRMGRYANQIISEIREENEQLTYPIRALELWMCTIAGGILPQRRADIISIWSLFRESLPQVGDAINELILDSKNTSAIFEEDINEWDYAKIDPVIWKNWCNFVPKPYKIDSFSTVDTFGDTYVYRIMDSISGLFSKHLGQEKGEEAMLYFSLFNRTLLETGGLDFDALTETYIKAQLTPEEAALSVISKTASLFKEKKNNKNLTQDQIKIADSFALSLKKVLEAENHQKAF